jgi:4-amino-4-deoxy-L-arabinose transferase-like glycosyltransferase
MSLPRWPPLRIAISPDVWQVLALMLLAVAILWNQIENAALYAPDAGVYALIGKELARRPFVEWAVLTWDRTPYYEHPHLTPWMLGMSMTLFGVGTTAAIIPITLVSTLTVPLTYGIGRALIDHRYGLLAATALALTPQFVRGARTAMLEPALMFCIMLAIYGALRAVPPRDAPHTVLMGLALGLAFLAKGPPAALALAAIVAFRGAALIFPGVFARFRVPPGRSAVQLLCALGIAAGLVLLVDLWHYAVTGDSFFRQYAGTQLRFTVVESRREALNDLAYYVKAFRRYLPWLPFMLLSLPLVLWRRDRAAVPALLLGSLVTLGTFLGFTIMTHKASWYVAIHYAGSSLLAALTLRYLLPPAVVQRYYARSCAVAAVSLLLLSATFPSLFTRHARPTETFFEQAGAALGARLEGEAVADCIPVARWRGRFFFKFYLGATRTDCHDPAARFKAVDNRSHVFDRAGGRVLFSRHPYSIVGPRSE